MQQANKYSYNVLVGRAQTRIFAKDFTVKTRSNGKILVNYKTLLGGDLKLTLSRKQFDAMITKNIGKGNCVGTIIVIEIDCNQFAFDQIFYTLKAREVQGGGRKDFCVIDMEEKMGQIVMSTLTNSKIDSLSDCPVEHNEFDWSDSKLFALLITLLSRQSELEKFNFSGKHLTTE